MLRPRTIAPHVELFAVRTPTLPPATHTNSYALGGRDVLLVEPSTPFDDERRELLAWARGLASQGRRLVGFFCTHHHADHIGGAAFFSRELAVPLLAHEATFARIREKLEGAPERLLGDGDEIVLDGQLPLLARVLHTPGHAAGHLCLHEPSLGLLVVGDMVASQGTIVISPDDGGDMGAYLAQLARLEALSAVAAFPAHGEPIDRPSELFSRYIAHRLGREAKVLAALVARGRAEARELLAEAYADTPLHLHGIALLSLRAHLAKLEGEGRVSRDGGSFVAIGAPS